ncbi:hypothetical protein BHOIPH791_05440 [Bartonella henselae]|nr:hypothetical protein BH623125_08510 [Bartonella henselae]GFF03197.1 hypothetical protein BH80429_00180 [Bartonella henselae]
MVFFPMRLRASLRPMVVVFSSPIGVGLIAVMRILPSGFLLSDFI